MQTRSFRGSGEPAWVNASPNACFGLGPDPRRALGPAAIRAASTGRTHDRTRPMLHHVKKALVNQDKGRVESRSAAGSCVLSLVAARRGLGPHLDLERIRTRKNRPRIQGANFRWGLPIRDGDTFLLLAPWRSRHGKKREAPAPARWWRGAVKRAARVSEALRGPPSTKQYVAGLRRQVPHQEGARPVDGAGLQLRRILPGKHR